MNFERKILLSGLILFIVMQINAQHSNTLYHLKGVVPQSYMMNPANQPVCGFHLGLPGLNPVDFRAGIPFSMNDIMYYDQELDSTITFLHPRAPVGYFTDRIRDNNYLHSEMSTGLASWGFRVDDLYFSFDMRTKMYANINIPGDFLKFLLEFNEDGDIFNFDQFDLSTRVYNEYSMGVSKNYRDNFTIGLRGKLLFGVADLSLKNSNLNMHTTKDLWTVNSDFTINANVPFVDIPLNEEGNYSMDSIEFNDDLIVSDVIGPAMFNNFGLGMDLGVIYNPVERISLSASIIDMAFIKWKNNSYNVSQKTTFEFDGVAIDSIGSEKFSEYLVDSITNSFDLIESRNAYNTFLPTKIYIGGEFMINPGLSLGILSMSELYHKRIREELTLSANFNPGKALSFSVAYSILNYSFNNLGFGISSKLGPFNMYLVMDNIPLVMAREVNDNFIIPHKTKNFNFKLGMNLVFGCNREKRLRKDKPMLE